MNEPEKIPSPEPDANACENAFTAPENSSAALLPAKPISRFDLADTVFAWGCLLLGYLFIRFAFSYSGGICGGIFWALTGALGAVYVKLKKYPVTKWHTVVFAIAEVFCLAPLFSSNRFVNTLAALFSYLLIFYLAAAVSGAELFGKDFAADMLSAVFARPLANFGKAPAAAVYSFRGKNRMKNVLYVLIGLIAALPLTIIVLLLLSSADSVFADVIDKVFFAFDLDIGASAARVIFGALFGMYLFGMLFSIGTERKSAYNPAALQKLPPAVSYAAVTPICVFYLIYLITQLGYFTAAFGGELPQGYSYSEFARKGFFELCAVAVINLCVIIIMQLITARKADGSSPAALKVYTVVISVFTLLLVASAFSKMIMYIGELGMTPLRIYTAWFMLVMSAAFVLIIIVQFKRLHFWRVMFAAFTVMFAVLCFTNVDGLIARYNVNAYTSGNIAQLDFDALSDLSVAAVKPVADMLEEPCDEQIRAEALDFFRDMLLDKSYTGWEYFSIPAAQAQEVFAQYDIAGSVYDIAV